MTVELLRLLVVRNEDDGIIVADSMLWSAILAPEGFIKRAQRAKLRVYTRPVGQERYHVHEEGLGRVVIPNFRRTDAPGVLFVGSRDESREHERGYWRDVYHREHLAEQRVSVIKIEDRNGEIARDRCLKWFDASFVDTRFDWIFDELRAGERLDVPFAAGNDRWGVYLAPTDWIKRVSRCGLCRKLVVTSEVTDTHPNVVPILYDSITEAADVAEEDLLAVLRKEGSERSSENEQTIRANIYYPGGFTIYDGVKGESHNAHAPREIEMARSRIITGVLDDHRHEMMPILLVARDRDWAVGIFPPGCLQTANVLGVEGLVSSEYVWVDEHGDLQVSRKAFRRVRDMDGMEEYGAVLVSDSVQDVRERVNEAVYSIWVAGGAMPVFHYVNDMRQEYRP